jgi:hypothetical protein
MSRSRFRLALWQIIAATAGLALVFAAARAYRFELQIFLAIVVGWLAPSALGALLILRVLQRIQPRMRDELLRPKHDARIDKRVYLERFCVAFFFTLLFWHLFLCMMIQLVFLMVD